METKATLLCASLLSLVAVAASIGPSDMLSWMSGSVWSTYNKKIFPRLDQTENVTVDIKMYLIAITDFDELGGQMSTVGYIKVKWTNDFLTWDTGYSPIESILLPQSNFWLLPLLLCPTQFCRWMNLVTSVTECAWWKTGDCEWTVGMVTKTACSVDVSYYPFDKQECEIALNPWGYNDNQVRNLHYELSFSVISLKLLSIPSLPLHKAIWSNTETTTKGGG